MFLHLLKNNQKPLFLQLAIKAAEANGVVDLSEKNMLKAYGIEMGITPFYTTEREVADVLYELKGISSDSDLRIILFEILAIMISDEELDDDENDFVQSVRIAFGVPQGKCDEMLNLLNAYTETYREIIDVVL